MDRGYVSKQMAENQQLRGQLATYAEHYDLAPHNGCTCKLCQAITKFASAKAKVEKMREAWSLGNPNYNTNMFEIPFDAADGIEEALKP